MITFDHVSYQYPDGTIALHDLSFTLPQGKKIALLGNNGAGKSTLFKHLNGLFQPTTGTIFMEDTPYQYNRKGLQALRGQVGIVFQDPDAQLFSGTVEQDIAFGPTNLGWSSDKIHAQVEHVITQLELESLRKKPIHFLSLGQKKRVAIAGVLAMEPHILILDEPSAGLDRYYANQIMKHLNDFHTEERTIILSTHDVDFAYEWADLVLVMQDGQMTYMGDPVALFEEQAILQAAHLERPLLFEVAQELGIQNLADYPRSRVQLWEKMKRQTTLV